MKLILCGEKRYEYRTRLCRKDISLALLYETTPVKRIIGEARVEGTLSMPKECLWQNTKAFSGISHEAFMHYFQQYENAHAYIIGEVTVYNIPQPLEAIGFHQAPQSFAYLKDESKLSIIRQFNNIKD